MKGNVGSRFSESDNGVDQALVLDAVRVSENALETLHARNVRVLKFVFSIIQMIFWRRGRTHFSTESFLIGKRCLQVNGARAGYAV
jgi:hypothetical protein